MPISRADRKDFREIWRIVFFFLDVLGWGTLVQLPPQFEENTHCFTATETTPTGLTASNHKTKQEQREKKCKINKTKLVLGLSVCSITHPLFSVCFREHWQENKGRVLLIQFWHYLDATLLHYQLVIISHNYLLHKLTAGDLKQMWGHRHHKYTSLSATWEWRFIAQICAHIYIYGSLFPSLKKN